MARVILQPTFVLHSRPFRDTSLLVDLFSLRYGRVNVIARGVRSAKSKLRGILLPFVPLLAAWSGKSELMTLGKVEANGASYDLSGTGLLSGLYLNELLVRLLAKYDPHPKVFHTYQDTLAGLQNSTNIQSKLRLFEKELLIEIGYGLQLCTDIDNQDIVLDKHYVYKHGHGFVCCAASKQANIFSGASLLALHHNQLTDSGILRDIKHLMRQVFAQLLGDRPLKSRELII